VATTSKKYDWINVSFLTITPPLAIILITWHLMTEGFLWQIWALGVFFYFLAGLSITAGYHRLISHRAYKAHPFLEAFYLFFGAGSFQNSALKWCTDHRRHHTKCDDHEEDPYAITKGFFFAHMGWIFEAEKVDQTRRWGKDLYNNPRIMFQHRYYMPIAILSGFIFPTVIGYFLGSATGGFIVAALGRIVFVHHATFLINSACHVWGTQPYGDDNSAKDSRFLSFFTYGEGHHNYHHHFQADYRNGVKWYDFDPTKWLISLSAKLGLATDLVTTDEEDILQARLKMQLKRALASGHQAPTVLEEKFNELRAILRDLKKRRKTFGEETWATQKAELRLRLQEFQGLLMQTA
jgi:stearoyl-CoA desaturase (Delta-9 desaturase)